MDFVAKATGAVWGKYFALRDVMFLGASLALIAPLFGYAALHMF